MIKLNSKVFRNQLNTYEFQIGNLNLKFKNELENGIAFNVVSPMVYIRCMVKR